MELGVLLLLARLVSRLLDRKRGCCRCCCILISPLRPLSLAAAATLNPNQTVSQSSVGRSVGRPQRSAVGSRRTAKSLENRVNWAAGRRRRRFAPTEHFEVEISPLGCFSSSDVLMRGCGRLNGSIGTANEPLCSVTYRVENVLPMEHLLNSLFLWNLFLGLFLDETLKNFLLSWLNDSYP